MFPLATFVVFDRPPCMRKPHPADEATRAAIATAHHFEVSLFRGPGLGHEVHPVATLDKARQVAELLPKVRGSSRLAIVYAVMSTGRSFMIPRDMQAPTMGELAMLTEVRTIDCAVPASPAASFISREYTDRSNCNKALKKHAEKTGQPKDRFEVFKNAAGAYQFRHIKSMASKPITPAPEAGKAPVDMTLNERGIPKALDRIGNITPEEVKASGEAAQRKYGRGGEAATLLSPRQAVAKAKAAENAASTGESDMRKVAKTTRSKARGKVTTERRVYDWKGAEEMAAKGKVPPPMDWSADTHTRFRPILADIVKAAKAGDVKALRAIKINPVSSSPKAADRYRGLCIKALTASKKSA